MLSPDMSRRDVYDWLVETDPGKLEQLYQYANDIRAQYVGDEIHLRGLIEISSYCSSHCTYCGLHAGNRKAHRYRMNKEQIMEAVLLSSQMNYGSVVLQSGEDSQIKGEWLADVVRTIKRETPCAVTLSIGERNPRDWKLWREAGADRYLLRFETSHPELFGAIHPQKKGDLSMRTSKLPLLKKLGYQVGSGVMIGFPGQTFDILADDLILFRKYNLGMIGVGPFLVHPDTKLGSGWTPRRAHPDDQVPSNVEMTCKVIALSRILRPDSHIPGTTALSALGGMEARIKGLNCGANVIMPNVTPKFFRESYTIYPGKTVLIESVEACQNELLDMMNQINRRPGTGPGHCHGVV